MYIRASPFSLSSTIVDRRRFFRIFTALKDLSASQEVTGNVRAICNSFLTLSKRAGVSSNSFVSFCSSGKFLAQYCENAFNSSKSACSWQWINRPYILKTVKQSETSTLELRKTDISLCADNDSLQNFVANSAIMLSK